MHTHTQPHTDTRIGCIPHAICTHTCVPHTQHHTQRHTHTKDFHEKLRKTSADRSLQLWHWAEATGISWEALRPSAAWDSPGTHCTRRLLLHNKSLKTWLLYYLGSSSAGGPGPGSLPCEADGQGCGHQKACLGWRSPPVVAVSRAEAWRPLSCHRGLVAEQLLSPEPRMGEKG